MASGLGWDWICRLLSCDKKQGQTSCSSPISLLCFTENVLKINSFSWGMKEKISPQRAADSQGLFNSGYYLIHILENNQ